MQFCSWEGIMGLTIRSATPADARDLLKIYAPYVTETAITYEYDVPSVEEFAERIRTTLEKYPYLVAELDGRAVGYTYAGIFHEREAYRMSAETSIYVAQGEHGHGVGRALYEALEDSCRQRGIRNLYACIAYTEVEDEHLTQGSVRFHTKLGYRMVGRFQKCARKFDHWYDMVYMEKFIASHE
jgi:phosphinothricin acetyltransferase